MKSDFKAFKKDMQILKNRITETDKMTDKLFDIFGGFEGELNDLLWELVANLIAFTQEKYDAKDWIDWYIYENDFGKNKYEAGTKTTTKKITKIKDLWELIKG